MDINSVYVGSNLSPHTTPSLFYLHLRVLTASVREARSPQVAGGNKLQVADFFPSLLMTPGSA